MQGRETLEISLTDLRFFARHGVLPQETKVGNEFIVSVKVCTPFDDRAAADDLDGTISYADIFAVVKEEMNKPRKLLEALAASIRNRLLSLWPQILSGEITICKSTPPIEGIIGSAKVTLIF